MKKTIKTALALAALLLAFALAACVAAVPPKGAFRPLVFDHGSAEDFTGPNGETAAEYLAAAFGLEAPESPDPDCSAWARLDLADGGVTTAEVFGTLLTGTRTFEDDTVRITFDNGTKLELRYLRSTYMLEYGGDAGSITFSASGD